MLSRADRATVCVDVRRWTVLDEKTGPVTPSSTSQTEEQKVPYGAFRHRYGLLHGYFSVVSSLKFTLVISVFGALRAVYWFVFSLEPMGYGTFERAFIVALPISVILLQLFFNFFVRRRSGNLERAKKKRSHHFWGSSSLNNKSAHSQFEDEWRQGDMDLVHDPEGRKSILEHLDYVAVKLEEEKNGFQDQHTRKEVEKMLNRSTKDVRSIMLFLFSCYATVLGGVVARFWVEELVIRPQTPNVVYHNHFGEYRYNGSLSPLQAFAGNTGSSGEALRNYYLFNLFGILEGIEVTSVFGHAAATLVLFWTTAVLHRLRLKLFARRTYALKRIRPDIELREWSSAMDETLSGTNDAEIIAAEGRQVKEKAAAMRWRFFVDYLLLKRLVGEASRLWGVFLVLILIIALAVGISCIYILFAGIDPSVLYQGSSSHSEAKGFASALASNTVSILIAAASSLLAVFLLTTIVVFVNEGVRQFEQEAIASKPSDFAVLGGREEILTYMDSNPIQFTVLGLRVDKRFVVGFIAAALSTFTIAAIVSNLEGGSGGN